MTVAGKMIFKPKQRSRRPLRAAFVLTLAGMLLAVVLPGSANAHFLGGNSVDAGEIRYDDHTKWDDSRNHGINQWNSLGSVDMRPDNAWTYTDLDIGDYDENDGRCGYYTYEPGADDVHLNTRYYNGYSDYVRRACTTHEFGHAYGLDHSYEDQVMDQCPVCSVVYNTPQSHDRDDWHQKWGY
jgi:hypothetical protein